MKRLITIFMTFSHLARAQQSQVRQDEVINPEKQVKLVMTDLEHIQKSLEAKRNVMSKYGLASPFLNTTVFYDQAQVYFSQKAYLSAIRELNQYLNSLQSVDMKDYLDAHYKLARSYDELGQTDKSARAYQRYLVAFMTSTSTRYDELLEVLRRLTELHVDSKTVRAQKSTNSSLRQFISGFATMTMPDEVRSEVYYLVAKMSDILGDSFLTQNLLDGTLKMEHLSPLQKMKTLYLRGILEIKQNHDEDGEKLLADVTKMNAENDEELKDLSHLTLARLAVKRRKPETAIIHYDLIPETSSKYKEALFEKLLVHMSLDHYENVSQLHTHYLKVYPGGADGLQLKSIQSYIEIASGNIDRAREEIRVEISRIEANDRVLQTHYMRRSALRYEDLLALTDMHQGLVSHPTLVTEGMRLFAAIHEQIQNLAAVKAEVMSTIMGLGNLSLNDVMPEVVSSMSLLVEDQKKMMDLGESLTQLQKRLYDERLTPEKRAFIAASELRRQKIRDKKLLSELENSHWSQIVNIQKNSQTLYNQKSRLNRLLAQNAGNFLTGASITKAPQENEKLSESIDATQGALVKAFNAVQDSITQLRKESIRNLVREDSFYAHSKIYGLYAMNLIDEKDVFDKLAPLPFSRLERMLFDDIQSTWRKWNLVATEIVQEFKTVRSQAASALAQRLLSLESQVNQSQTLIDDLETKRIQLEESLGRSAEFIARQYQNRLQVQLSRNEKWLGDLEYVQVERNQKASDAKATQDRVKMQILSDKLTDLEQGIE